MDILSEGLLMGGLCLVVELAWGGLVTNEASPTSLPYFNPLVKILIH